MDKPTFVYVTYITATPEKVWTALTDPSVTAAYWFHVNVSDWKPGSRWEHHEGSPRGELKLQGTVTEAHPPRRLVMTWADPPNAPGAERPARVTFEIEPLGAVVRLTVTHDEFEPGSPMLKSITKGWPKVLSSLKSYLETGRAIQGIWEL